MPARYYVYSIEAGSSPHDPYFDDDDFEKCVAECNALSIKQDVNAYVVDRTNTHFERYVRVSTHFTSDYEATKIKLEQLKANRARS
jgi:hypothetical protein